MSQRWKSKFCDNRKESTHLRNQIRSWVDFFNERKKTMKYIKPEMDIIIFDEDSLAYTLDVSGKPGSDNDNSLGEF